MSKKEQSGYGCNYAKRDKDKATFRKGAGEIKTR
jgi:hypothetical protein